MAARHVRRDEARPAIVAALDAPGPYRFGTRDCVRTARALLSRFGAPLPLPAWYEAAGLEEQDAIRRCASGPHGSVGAAFAEHLAQHCSSRVALLWPMDRTRTRAGRPPTIPSPRGCDVPVEVIRPGDVLWTEADGLRGALGESLFTCRAEALGSSAASVMAFVAPTYDWLVWGTRGLRALDVRTVRVRMIFRARPAETTYA